MALQAVWTPNGNPQVLDARCARCQAALGYAGPVERATGALQLHPAFVRNAETGVYRLSSRARAEWVKQAGHVVWKDFVPTEAKAELAQLPATVRCLCRAVNDITT